MDAESIKFLSIGLSTFGMMGVAMAIAYIFSSLFDGISRNPGAEKEMAKYVYVAAALAESMGLFIFVMSILLAFK